MRAYLLLISIFVTQAALASLDGTWTGSGKVTSDIPNSAVWNCDYTIEIGRKTTSSFQISGDLTCDNGRVGQWPAEEYPTRDGRVFKAEKEVGTISGDDNYIYLEWDKDTWFDKKESWLVNIDDELHLVEKQKGITWFDTAGTKTNIEFVFKLKRK